MHEHFLRESCRRSVGIFSALDRTFSPRILFMALPRRDVPGKARLHLQRSGTTRAEGPLQHHTRKRRGDQALINPKNGLVRGQILLPLTSNYETENFPFRIILHHYPINTWRPSCNRKGSCGTLCMNVRPFTSFQAENPVCKRC